MVSKPRYVISPLFQGLPSTLSRLLKGFNSQYNGPAISASQCDGSQPKMTELWNRRHEYFASTSGARVERLDHGFENDVRRLLTVFHYFQNPDSSTILWALQQLWQLARTEATSPANLSTSPYISKWSRGKWDTLGPNTTVYRYPENEIFLLAAERGLYEFSPPGKGHNDLLELTLYRVVDRILFGWYSKHNCVWQGETPFDRIVRSLAICLAYGVPANTLIWVKESHVSVSIWQNLVWHCIVTSTFRASLVPVWLLFLLHGAEQNFTLKFEQTCNLSQIDKSGKLISVTGLWGTQKEQFHSPIYIHEDQCGIVELAKVQDWSVSLLDIIGFWLPRHIAQFQRIHDLVGEGKVFPKDPQQLQNLKIEFASWHDQAWDIPEALFQSWEGRSELLPCH